MPIPVKSVLSNANALRLDQLIDVIAQTHRRLPFLEKGKALILVERNPRYLDRMILDLTRSFRLSLNRQEIPDNTSWSNYGNWYMLQYQNNDEQANIDEIIARVKGADSICEKLTRFIADPSWGSLEDPHEPGHLVIRDLYAFTFVARDDSACYSTHKRVMNLPNLLPEEQKDYLTEPKPSGYKAIHTYFQWHNGVPEMHGLRLEVHYETIDDHVRNVYGEEHHPERSHGQYSRKKLKKEHALDNYQIVIVDHRGNLNAKFTVTPVDLSEHVNGEVLYYLLRPTGLRLRSVSSA